MGQGYSVLRKGLISVGIPSSFPLVEGWLVVSWLRVGPNACIYSFIEFVLYVHRVPGPGTHRNLQCALVCINGSPLFRNILSGGMVH